MNRPLIIRPRAERDLAESSVWYEHQSSGTGAYFLRCVDAGLASISRQPEIGPVQFLNFRRVLVRRFPFGLFYTIEPLAVVVHGVFHLSRDPDSIRRLLTPSGD